MINPFAKPRPNPKRKEPRRVGPERVRFYGKERSAERERTFERSGGRCEEIWDGKRCDNPITLATMHWSHRRHGARKSDDDAIASCEECHRRRHNAGGKPCNRRPGKIMSITAAKAYWAGKVCFCDGSKKPQESFCSDCRPKVQPQTLYTLEKTDDQEVYRETLATAELQILAADRKGTL